ncbi:MULTISPECIES: hypothetical protein [Paraburkholderia]|uniref:hypothetical protein n=1 Tax=Paraburkholderia TaxID=1822464 RepID=UPI00190D7045|nr:MULTISPECIES: hypothetical protein [Paraburkholderia]MBK3745115.1 hypothetical protein [Paraburkholderia aspalathi]MBK5186282.1 hypothetical protein [Burkholderia sp. R-69749]CAE6855615.1 hypothetical protein R69619_07675 [Paraburkholderia nemoris]
MGYSLNLHSHGKRWPSAVSLSTDPSATTGRQKLANGRDIPHGERAKWMLFYRTLDKGGKTVAALWRARRKKGVAKRYIGEGQWSARRPHTTTIDGSGVNGRVA